MAFDFSKLIGRVHEQGLNISTLSKMCDISRKSLYAKLNSETQFKADEIAKISKVLKIEEEDIHKYFFTKNVSFSEQDLTKSK